MSRRFSLKQRQEIFLAANGQCQMCGCDLPPGWHADHVIPYSHGGPTDLLNAQALCPPCNEKKSNDMPGSITPRPFQAECIDVAITKAERGKDSLVTVAAPGSGKTLMSQMTMNELQKRGHINALLVLVPRLNLCEQYELDWKKDRLKLGVDVMGNILHVANNPPLLGRERDQFGVVTTYQSLVSRPELYLRMGRRHRLGVVLDEAHQLGIEDATGQGTESAFICDELAELASFTIVMTGTEVRSDGMRILPSVVGYTEPQDGYVYLQADVESRYRDGVHQGFLRRFEYELHDGSARRHFIDRSETLTLSDMESGISDVVTEEGYWQPMVDKTVQRIREMQREVDPRMCGLIGAARQDHAEKIIGYLKTEHSVKALLAVSRESKAQKNLRKFRAGGYDVLVTVGMAHVGYDHKPISVVCCLNAYRQFAWLFQFFARGLRVMSDVDERRQYLRAIVPDDPPMRDFVEQMRSESEQGLRLRDRREETAASERSDPEIYDVDDGAVTRVTAMGLDPSADINPDFYDQIREPAEELAPGVPLTNLKQLIDRVNGSKPQAQSAGVAVMDAPTITHKERLEKLRRKINKAFKQTDAALMREGHNIEWSYTAGKCMTAFNGQGLPDCKSMEDLKRREGWLKNFRQHYGFSPLPNAYHS